MGTVILLQVQPEMDGKLRSLPSLGQDDAFTLVDSSDELLAHLQHGADQAELIVLGPGLEEPIRLAERIRSMDTAVPVLILSTPDRYPHLVRARQFSPFLSEDVHCHSTVEGEDVRDVLQEMITRVRQQQSYRAMIAAVNVRLATSTSKHPPAVQYLDRLLDHAPIGVVVVDRDGLILTWNRKAGDILGMGEREALGRPLIAVFPDTEQEPLQRLIADCSATDQPSPPALFRRLTRDGEQQFVEVTAAALSEQTGEAGALVLVAEVTRRVRAERERKEAEQALASQLRLMETISSNATLALFLMDARQHCTFMNPAAEQITGFTLTEVQGQPLHEFVHHTRPDDTPYPLAECPIYRALPTRNRMEGEEVFVHKDGSFYPVAFTASPILEDDVPVGTVIEVQDITARKQAEEKLKLYQQIFAHANDAIAVVDPQGVYREQNAAHQALIGHSNDELRGKTPSIHLGEEAFSTLAEALLTTGTFRGEFLSRTKSGEQIPIELSAFSMRDAAGEIVCHVGIKRDISERKQAEDLLSARLRQQAVVAELGQRALAGIDLASLVDEAVTAVSETLAVEYAEVLERLPDGQALRLQAGVGWHEGLVGQATVDGGIHSQAGYTLLSHVPVIVEDLRTETRFQGASLLREHRVVSGLSVIIAGQDQPFGVLGAHTTQQRVFTENDVHFLQAVANVLAMAIERQQTEEAERFLTQASTILASTLDYDTTIEQITRLAIPTLADWCTLDILEQGHSRCVAVAHVDPAKEGRLWELRRHYPLLPDGPSPGSQVLRTEQSVLHPRFQAGELPQTTQDAEHLRLITALSPVSAMAVPLNVHGKTIGVMTLASVRPERRLAWRDVRLAEELANRAAIAIDNARLYREARRAIRTREEFVSIASHELKTPLTTIKTYAQLLARQVHQSQPDHERLRGHTTRLQEQVDRLERLVADLLDASRIQQGRLALAREHGNLAVLAQAVLERFAEAPERAAYHRLVLDAPQPVVGAWDLSRLDQVLTNLVSNALKYSPEWGEVRVTVQQVDGQALVSVSDQGIGITPKEQGKLFQPFERGEAVRGSVSGTGLGLYITRQVVEQHGGTISVQSEPGRGTCFLVRLPLAPPDRAIAAK